MDSYDNHKALITVDESWVEFQEIVKDIVTNSNVLALKEHMP